MKLLHESDWRDYLPQFHHDGGAVRYIGFSLGNRNCDPLLSLEVEYHPLWTDVGEAIEGALRERKMDDFREFGITWQMLVADHIDKVARSFYRRLEGSLLASIDGLGKPDQVIVDDTPLDLRDVAE